MMLLLNSSVYITVPIECNSFPLPLFYDEIFLVVEISCDARCDIYFPASMWGYKNMHFNSHTKIVNKILVVIAN